MPGEKETASVEQDTPSVLAVREGDLGVSLVSSLQSLEDAGWGLVSLVCSFKESFKVVTPIIGQNVCQLMQLIGL